MTGKYLTILVVPHDERNVRRLRLSYRRLRILAVAAVLVAAVGFGGAVTWGRVAARAARTELLERENRRLADANAKVGKLAANVERSERAYERIRRLVGLSGRGPAAPVVVASPSSGVGSADEKVTERPSELRGRGGAAPSGWPLTIEGFVTAEYSGREGHTGIDIAVPVDTPVVATASGSVKQTGSDAIYGNFIVLGHEGGYETMYSHNGHLLVARGEQVARGQIIAYSGNSGQSSAPHLHYEVRREGWPVDPAPFLH